MFVRAAGLHVLAGKDFPILTCDKAADFMECVWQLTAYTYPESISLPQDYQPPNMAITASYWKAWQMLLIMTAYNPEDFGTAGWKSYPTLRALISWKCASLTRSIVGKIHIYIKQKLLFCSLCFRPQQPARSRGTR